MKTFTAADRAALGHELTLRRRELGITQRDLEVRSRIPQGRISRIERGIAHATVDELNRVVKTLEMTVRIDLG